MRFPKHVIHVGLWVVLLAVACGRADGQSTFTPDIQLSIQPLPPTSSDHTYLAFSIPNFGVNVLSKFAPTVAINDNSISVALTYLAAEIAPGEVGLPSSFFPNDRVDLGKLPRGNYTLTATLPDHNAVVIGSATTTFSVVPEATTASLAVIATSILAWRGGRLTRRWSPRRHRPA
jgi:hypothetical protein